MVAVGLSVLGLPTPAFAAPQKPDSLPEIPGLSAPAPRSQPVLEETLETSPESPRSTVAEYLMLCRAGRFGDAARFLDLPKERLERGPALARRLSYVLDRFLWIDLDLLSRHPEGNREDGMPPDVEDLGTIPTDTIPAPVRLVRRYRRDGPHWLFSASTVDRVDVWYERLEDRFLREHLPEPLFRPGPKELLWWQWIAVLLSLPVLWAVGYGLSYVTRRVSARAARKTHTKWDDAFVALIGGPVALGWVLVLAYALLPLLGLYKPAWDFMVQTLKAGFVLAFFWLLFRVVGIAGQVLAASQWTKNNPSAPSLLSIGVRAGRVTVVVFGILAAVAQLGYPVGSLLAGLGIGGLALALAAQKTVENLFGSVSIGIDQPLRVGELVRIGDLQGTVEGIGLRSTRIRTPDRTLVTIPNGKLADMQIETFAPRDRVRLSCVLGLVLGTSAAQMRNVLKGLEGVLRKEPALHQEELIVSLRDIGPASLNIEVNAWFETAGPEEFRRIREACLLAFLDVIEHEGTSLAYPTQTIHLASAGRIEGRGAREAAA